MDTQLFDVSRPCVLEVRNLCKRYGKDEQAVNALLGVKLRLRSGEILGVLGPNGAGKTTLVEILEGLRVADFGRGHGVRQAGRSFGRNEAGPGPDRHIASKLGPAAAPDRGRSPLPATRALPKVLVHD